MKFKKPPEHVLISIIALLKPYCNELTADGLIEILRNPKLKPKDQLIPGQQSAPGKLLSIKETAKRLECGERTVWRLLKENKLPRVKLGSRSTRIPEISLISLP